MYAAEPCIRNLHSRIWTICRIQNHRLYMIIGPYTISVWHHILYCTIMLIGKNIYVILHVKETPFFSRRLYMKLLYRLIDSYGCPIIQICMNDFSKDYKGIFIRRKEEQVATTTVKQLLQLLLDPFCITLRRSILWYVLVHKNRSSICLLI